MSLRLGVASFPAETVRALREWRKRQAEERLAFGPRYQDTGLVFTRPDGSLVHPDRVSRAFKRHVREAGLPPLSIHGLRHTWASLALQAGVNPKVVSEQLGHSTVSLTLDVYSHVIPSLGSDAATKVAGVIFG